MDIFFSQLTPAEKLDIYKKVKIICNAEGLDFVFSMQEVLNDKVADIYAALDEYFNTVN